MASSRRLLAVQNHLQQSSSSSSSSSAMASPYKSPITSHILDTARGKPAANVRIELHALDAATGAWHKVNHGFTNDDGRVATALVPEGFVFAPGTYKMVFDTKSYFDQTGVTEYFYPDVSITFLIKHTGQHYHVPLLINPFGFSTYRGS